MSDETTDTAETDIDSPADTAGSSRKTGRVWRVLRRVSLALVLVVALFVGWVYFSLNRGGDPPDPAGLGANPQLAPPDEHTIPTVNSPEVVGWPKDKAPTAPEGFRVTRFAEGLAHPRWLYELPNGDVLAAEAASIPQDEGLVMDLFRWLRRADGSTGPSANRITLLRDTDGDGVADDRTRFLDNLNQPFGMALLGDWLYVANTDSVLRFPYRTGDTRITTRGQKILDLPAGGYNNHWTRNIVARPNGKKLYVSVGSGSNIGENGLDNEARRANVLEINPDGSGERILASGLRNPNGLDFEPSTGTAWSVVNERDLLGDDAAPDYLTRVRAGDFYGWPWAYWGQADPRVEPPRPDLVAKSVKPDYSLGAHSAPLGLAFSDGSAFPKHYQGGAFVAEHGSWNRGYPVGYKVVYIPFRDGMPTGKPEDFLTGFKPDPTDAETYGRPVGVITDKAGGLLVTDDAANIVWRVSTATTK
jgi:glucose/arabinose dehydrogenase